MNPLTFFTKAYSRLHNYSAVPFWVLTPMRKVVRFGANRVLPHYLLKPRKINKIEGTIETKVIVSLTSFPARIDNVWQVVECMMRQTLTPAKIILWLSKEQFPIPEGIPVTLREREGDMFEIRLVDGDIRSHKKYYYVSTEFPNSLVFLADDDIYYPTTILERTVNAYNLHPNAIICNYGYHIGYKGDGNMKPYNSWKKEFHYSESNDLFFGSGGGTLISPAFLHKELTNMEKAIELAPIADDIWLNAVVKLSGKKIVLLDNGMILPVYNRNDEKLASVNKEQSQNDVQLEAVTNYMKSHYDGFSWT